MGKFFVIIYRSFMVSVNYCLNDAHIVKTTVQFSTHIRSDVEHVCDRVAALDGGHLVLQGDIETLKKIWF
ncbi:MAG TPA: hypothetical protein VHT34_08100 [Clostridia bacterium]|nr:hypothetical protein [Clostridia bacterium]